MSSRERLAEQGYALLLRAIGTPATATQIKAAARLWCQTIAHGTDPAAALGRGQRANSHQPVLLRDIDVHLVCPHHLTVAFGTAAVAYIPGPRIVGFGRLVRLVEACTARLALQEDATTMIANTLVQQISAVAAIACVRAAHPCHSLSRPKGHRSQAVTWASAGDPSGARQLLQLVGVVA